MAYAFSRVNQALGGDAAQENQDIFGGGAQPQGVQGQDAAGTTPQGVVKTSSAGTIGAAPTTSEIKTPQEASAGGAGAASKILATNQSTTPEAVKSLGGKLSNVQSALQGEADQYVTKAKNTNFNVADTDVNDLIGASNTEGAKKASGLLAGTVAPQVEKFAPTTQTNLQEVNQLGTEAGIQNMLRRQGGARTTQGELGIEAALLRRDPRFQQTRSQLLGQNAALQKTKSDLTGDTGVTKTAQDALGKNYGAAQTDLRGKLGKAQSDIDATIAANVTAENNARHALDLRNDPGVRAVFEKLKSQYGDIEGDPYALAKVSGDVTAEDLYDQGSASKYSRISDLLGNPGQRRVAGKGAGDRFTIDDKAYADAAAKLKIRRENEKNAPPPTPIEPINYFPNAPEGPSGLGSSMFDGLSGLDKGIPVNFDPNLNPMPASTYESRRETQFEKAGGKDLLTPQGWAETSRGAAQPILEGVGRGIKDVLLSGRKRKLI